MARKKDTPCADCGAPIWRGSTRCRACRHGELAHGTRRMYRERGCRCEECRAYMATSMRGYVARVRERDGVTPTQKIRPRVTAVRPCAVCGESVTGKATSDAPTHNACRPEKFWANAIQISDRDRLAIYERDGWCCQLCGDLVDRTLNAQHRWAATLDHIHPRSLTLFPDDSPENLRLAHRACNSARGNRVA